MIELLAPAGNLEKLKIALHYGADAVYMAGKNYGLRAFCDNFTLDGMQEAVAYAHCLHKKIYVTLNIYAYEEDFNGLVDYIHYLKQIGVDAVIVSDPGIISLIKKHEPGLSIHLSTQANTTNSYSVEFWAEMGLKRIVLARELSLKRIEQIKARLGDRVELEAFVHGAMCIAYSGRCLLSNFMANRPSNHGECAQSCRWEYFITEKSRSEPMQLQEDERGTYILNSRDMNMLAYIDQLAKAGVTSFKIEGRNKSIYYAATVVNAYRRAINAYENAPDCFVLPSGLEDELTKAGHRLYCTGFYFGEASQCLTDSKPKQDYDMCAVVIGDSNLEGWCQIEHRNRFTVGEELEVLTPLHYLNNKIIVTKLLDERGAEVMDANRVQQKLQFYCNIPLHAGDILRKKSKK